MDAPHKCLCPLMSYIISLSGNLLLSASSKYDIVVFCMIKYQGLTTLEVLEGAEHYNKWITDQFLPYAKTPLLEIGSGTGNLSRFFITKPNVFLSDIDSGLLKNLQQKFPSKSKQIIHLDIEKEAPKHLKNTFRSIIGINVLEHIKYDDKALTTMYSLLQKNGNLFLLVPAKKFAYTQLDKRLGHFRRYEKKEIQEKLRNAGFVIESLYFFNFIGLVSWVVRDKIEQGNHLKPYQVILFDKIVPALRVIESFCKPFIGVSLIIRAKKR